jgi:PAS domain S-box-containing protein
MKNITDKRLLTGYLRELGYIVNESLADEWSNFDMILTDEFFASQFGRNLLMAKNHSSSIFLPMIIMLAASGNASTWMKAGYDNVIRMPIRKVDLAGKIKFWLQLREQTENKYQLIFDNVQVGIYRMNAQNRVLTANSAFLNIVGYQSIEQVMSRNLVELGVTFQESRDTFLKKVMEVGKVSGYESCWVLKDGKKISVREGAMLLKDEANDSFYYIGTIENISQ